MHRSATLFALGALSSTATASWFKSHDEPSWSPPRQTGIYGEEAGEQAEIAIGWSPVPTDAPKLSGAMDMGFALGKRALEPQTCGFGEAGNSFTCISADATCSLSSGYVGCCETGRSCNLVKTTCVDFVESASVCKFLEDFHTLCCGSTAPSCFSWIGTQSGETYTLLDCTATTGTSTLLFSDPLAETDTSSTRKSSTTDEPSSTTDETGPVTVTESAGPTTTSSNPDPGPNVGAIAGGTVGGVAALGLVGLLGFLLFRRRKKSTPAATPLAGDGTQGPPPAMAQAQSPQNSYVPSSPSNAAYPSGVPSNFQGYQQPYDPNMAVAYGQPQGYQQPGYSGYSPQPQNFQGQYPQQGFGQQSQYPSQYGVGFGAPSTSPPPQAQFTPSPGPKEGNEVSQPQQHVQELPAVSPLGKEGNRAELS